MWDYGGPCSRELAALVIMVVLIGLAHLSLSKNNRKQIELLIHQCNKGIS